MDNLTHTLIGVLAGESIARAAPETGGGLPPDVRRNLLVTTMAVGSNLPDLDFLYSAVAGGKLEYLLHHRGHTHTIIGALATAVLLAAALQAWMRWKRLRPAGSDRVLSFAVALLAPLLHVAMDLANNYGVHPFWPFDNRWFYGDSVFIIEPLLWAACAPLAFAARTRAARSVVMLVLAAGVALTFFSGLVPFVNAIVFTLLTAVLVLISRRARPSIALACGVALWLGVTLTFALASETAGRRADALAARVFPNEALYDRVLTPMPVNPLCWEVIFVSGRGDDVALRRAMLSLAPERAPPEHCLSRSLEFEATAPLREVKVADGPEIKWYGETASSRSRLASVVAADCRAAAFMRFARAPWIATIDQRLVLGDLRYDREAELGFAEIDLSSPQSCPAHAPPWLPPRTDLLR